MTKEIPLAVLRPPLKRSRNQDVEGSPQQFDMVPARFLAWHK